MALAIVSPSLDDKGNRRVRGWHTLAWEVWHAGEFLNRTIGATDLGARRSRRGTGRRNGRPWRGYPTVGRVDRRRRGAHRWHRDRVLRPARIARGDWRHRRRLFLRNCLNSRPASPPRPLRGLRPD